MRSVTGVLRADVLRVRRDPMLALLAVIPIALAAVTRVLAPAGLALLPPWATVRGVESGVTAGLVLLTPMMFGFVFGLMLLDERDEGVLVAVSLTPVGKTGFLLRRMAAPIVWSIAATGVVLALAGLVDMPLAQRLVLSLLAGLQAPILALFIGAFAPDKVRGMALAKVGSVLVTLGALGVLAPHPWRWLAAPSPHFWLTELTITKAVAPSFAADSLLALTSHVVVLAILVRVFEARTG